MARTAFAGPDHIPAPMHALLFGALESMGRHPEIRRVRAAAFDALRPAPGQRLLDAGAGTGDVARELAGRVAPGGSVVALDASEAFLAGARERHDGSEVSYVTGDVMDLAWPDGGFDGVWCERVLQHVPDADLAVRELARVTRPGGRVCLIDTDWQSLAFDGVPTGTAGIVRQTMISRMPGNQSAMGRTLRRRLVQAGLRDVSAVPLTCVFPDPASAAVVLPMVNPAVPRDTLMVPEALRDEWLAEVAAAGARGEFLAVLTLWVAAGTV
jgi:SAM-dependent methyltransferase